MYYGNDILMSFVEYSGGKFVKNCICLSKYFLFNSKDKDLEYLINNPEDYQYKLKCILSTLPKKENMKHWRTYEFGEIDRNSTIFLLAKKKGFRFARTMHSFSKDLLNLCKDAVIIKLINYEKFRDIASKLKHANLKETDECESKYKIVAGDDWPSFQKLQSSGFNTKFLEITDQNILEDIHKYYQFGTIENKMFLYDKDKIFNMSDFMSQMKKLYEYLNLDDFNEELVSVYYTEYMKLH